MCYNNTVAQYYIADPLIFGIDTKFPGSTHSTYFRLTYYYYFVNVVGEEVAASSY